MELKKEYLVSGNKRKIKKVLEDLEYYGRIHPLIKSVAKKENENFWIQ